MANLHALWRGERRQSGSGSGAVREEAWMHEVPGRMEREKVIWLLHKQGVGVRLKERDRLRDGNGQRKG